MSRNDDWREIPGFPGYSASTDGAIRSNRTGRVLKQSMGSRGRLRVGLRLDGEPRSREVHGLVCAAFHGDRPPGMEVSHQDGDKLNNEASNLRWETRKENASKRREHATEPRGYSHPKARLSPGAIEAAWNRRAAGESIRSIADDHDVHPSVISRALAGKTYA